MTSWTLLALTHVRATGVSGKTVNKPRASLTVSVNITQILVKNVLNSFVNFYFVTKDYLSSGYK